MNGGNEADPPVEAPEFGPDEDILAPEIREGDQGRRETR